jgi:ArsR family transcriptional regulator
VRSEDCDRLADFVKALTNPLRLRILCVLQGGERSVSEIVAHTCAKQANVSIQLGILRSRGIVAPRRSENNVFYSISDPRVIQLLELMLEVARDARL